MAAGHRVTGLVELADEQPRLGTEIHGLPVRAADDLPQPGALAVVGAGDDRLAHWAVLAAAPGWRPATVVHAAATRLAQRRARRAA